MTPEAAARPPAPPEDPEDTVLSVRDLSLSTAGNTLVSDVSFSLAPGDRVGLIGESGSGKSLTALALMGLLPDEVRARGSVRLAGEPTDLMHARERTLAAIRGRQMSMVFQEPMTALNPVMRVGKQVAEVLAVHGRDARSARDEAVHLLEQVRLPDPAAAARAYPHQLSGGQRQRVMLAIALANQPSVLLCDEPTTALDVTVQAQMLELIATAVAQSATDTSLLFITHDLAVVATVCDRVLVMYGGRIVEAGPVREVFTQPRHPYTRGLLDASDLEATDERGMLRTIPGTVPPAGGFPDGCVFRSRCTRADARCAHLPAWHGDRTGHACWHPVEAVEVGS